MKIKILNLNCFGLPLFFNKKLRYNLFLKKLEKLNYDFIFLQEIVFKKEAQTISKALKFLGYKSFFETRHWFNSGGLLIASRIKNLQAEFIPFNNQGPKFSFTSFFERIIKKGFLYLKTRIKNKDFFFITTHLSYASASKLAIGQGEKLFHFSSQVRQLNSFLKDKKNCICGGDFNFPPSFFSYSLIQKEGGFKEVSSAQIKTLDANNFYRQRWIKLGFEQTEPTAQDYLFYKGEIKRIKACRAWDNPLSFKNKQYYISDHYGIEATFEI